MCLKMKDIICYEMCLKMKDTICYEMCMKMKDTFAMNVSENEGYCLL